MKKTHLLIGGFIAMGFDPSGKYLITVSHSGRGVFSTETWKRLARDYQVIYPEQGFIKGIGPVVDQAIPIRERNEENQLVKLESPNGRYILSGESDGVTIFEKGT